MTGRRSRSEAEAEECGKPPKSQNRRRKPYPYTNLWLSLNSGRHYNPDRVAKSPVRSTVTRFINFGKLVFPKFCAMSEQKSSDYYTEPESRTPRDP